jgi:cob(I)alamin adenosyltransferase
MLYTRKGDNGTTKLFNCPQSERLSKSIVVFEALGALDELNCSLGFAVALAKKSQYTLKMSGQKTEYVTILEHLQNTLFIIQAELGGANKHPSKADVDFAEFIVAEIEKVLPPVTSFIVPGGGETGAYLDICRTIARRAERSVIKVLEEDKQFVGEITLQFLNRLSSALYALARFANYQGGFLEHPPSYG